MAIIEVSKQITNYLDSEQTASAPANPVEGQRWTDTSKSPPVAMIYTEGDWKPERLSVEVLDPDFYQDLEDTKTEVAAAIEKAEAAEKAGKDAQAAGEAAQSAASEAKQAGENAANLASQATLDAQEAKAKADAIQIDVNGLVSDVATINGTVTAISSKANEAYEKATAVEGRTATLETSVTGLTGRMTDIETTSTSTTKKLNELVVTVDGQKQTIATVTTTADSALNKANVLETTVDGVTQTLTSVETTANSALSKVNTVSSTVDGHTQLIASTKTTADSALSKAVATETTVNGLKTTVSSVETTANSALTKATSVEQTANGLTTTVTQVQTDLNNLNMGSRNYIQRSKEFKGYTQGSIEGVQESDGTLKISVNTDSSNQPFAVVNTWVAGAGLIASNFSTGDDITLSIWIKSASGKLPPQGYIGSGMGYIAPNPNTPISAGSYSRYDYTFKYNLTSGNISPHIRFSNQRGEYYVDRVAIFKSSKGMDWTPAPEDMATSSQITQLSDTINLKVSKGEVLNQINVSTEGILIAGNKLNITAQTTIDNAVIKTAHIADLAVSNGKIANLAVTEGKIGNLAVTTAKIADLAVNNAKIASLDAAKINTGYLAAARIAASSITTDKLNVATLSAITANLGTVNAGTINGVTINGSEFINAFSYTESGVTYTGTTMMKDGNVVISRTGSDGSSWTTKVDRQLGFEDSYKAGSTAPARTTRLGQGKLYMVESGVGGYLPASALNPTSWVNLPYASGWTTAENNPCQYRMFPQLDGSYLIRFRGQFAPTSGTIPSGNQQPFGAGGIPVAIRPDKTEFGYGASNQNAGGRLAISGAGNFFYNPETTGQTYCSISGISYYIG